MNPILNLHGSNIRATIEALSGTPYELRYGLSVESQQEDQANVEQSIRDLFVIVPKQTGFSAVAALMKQAMRSPTTTYALIENPPTLSPADQQDRTGLIDQLSELGASVFETPDQVKEYLHQMELPPSPDLASATDTEV